MSAPADRGAVAPRAVALPLGGRWAALIAAGGGALGAAAFPQLGWWWAAPISCGALSVAVHRQRLRRSAWLGLIWGLAFFVPLLHWTSIFVGAPPWLILAATEAAYIAVLGPVLTLVQRLAGWPLWVGAAWVGQEALRGRAPFGGFPWGRWAFSQAESPARWLAAVGGAPLVSAAVALSGGCAAWGAIALLNARLSRTVAVRAGVAGVLAVASLIGASALAPLLNPRTSDDPTMTVALIQGSVPKAGLQIETRRREVLDNHVRATLDLADRIAAGTARQPDVVLWPENASDIDPFENPDAAAQIESAVTAVRAPILVGAILDGPGDRISNVGILWSPGSGPGAVYSKRHPVPFAEYIPLRGLARLVSSDVELVERDMAAGSGNGLITGGPTPIGDVICFEIAYDGLVRSSVSAGAQVIVAQTNNATFGRTSETYQQLAMSKLRAVEHGRVVLQVSTSGKSAIIGPDGRVEQESGALYTAATLEQDVALRTQLTLATRLGAAPEWALTAIAVVAAALALAGGLMGRRYDSSFARASRAENARARPAHADAGLPAAAGSTREESGGRAVVAARGDPDI